MALKLRLIVEMSVMFENDGIPARERVAHILTAVATWATYTV